MNEKFPSSLHFDAYAMALLRHHDLLSAPEEDSIRIEAIEDQMSALWGKLDENQKKEIRGISSDLNWLPRSCLPPPKGRGATDVKATELADHLALNERGDFLPLLRATRICAPALPNGFVALARARCYFNLGWPELAEPFLKASVDLNPDRSQASRSSFILLIHVSPSGAFDKASEVIASPQKYPPVVVSVAIQYFLDLLGGDSPSYSKFDLAEKLLGAEKSLEDEPTPDDDRVFFYSLGGSQLLSFGFPNDGIRFLEAGLKLEPANADLQGWLGEALYARDRVIPVEVFQSATAGGTTLVRPYLFLAHHYLTGRDFVRSNSYATRAADMAREDLSRAAALEVMAITLSELGSDSKVVLGLLRQAARLAPGIERITMNLRSFESRIQKLSPVTPWDTESYETGFDTRSHWREKMSAI